MSITAYNYFKNIFCQSDEMIICVDGEQRVVYATGKVLSAFERDSEPLLSLNCILSIRACDCVASAMTDTPHSVSFDFVSTIENTPRRCVVIPMEFDGEYYYVLYFSKSSITAIDRVQKQDIIAVVEGSVDALADCVVSISDITSELSDDEKAKVHSTLAKIEKVFKNIEAVTTDRLYTDRVRIINLHDYVRHLMTKIANRLEGFEFAVLPCLNSCLSKIAASALDLMSVNILNEIFWLYDKSPHVYVSVSCDSEHNYIVFTGSEHGLGLTTDELLKQSNAADTAPLGQRCVCSRAVCQKVARDNDVRVFFTASFGGGVTHGLMLKKVRHQQSLFYDGLDDYKDDYSLLDVLLADF